MLPRKHPDRIQIAFDDHRLVANAGLLLPATLAQHLGLPQLVDRHVDLGRAPGQHRRQADDPGGLGPGQRRLYRRRRCVAHRGDGLHPGRHGQSALHPPLSRGQALGTFPRSFRWGHVRQLDRVSRELLARAWAAGAGPGDAPFTIDLDSTICETYGLAKEGARHHSYTGARGYHPLLARLREGRANTARGAGHFLRETVRRVKPTPGSQLALFATYSYHGFITDRDGETLELEAGHRRHAEIENAIRDLKYGVGLNHLPSGRFAANAAWLAVQSPPRTRYGVLAHNLARWAARIGLGEQLVTTKTLRRRFFALPGGSPARHAG